MHVQLLHVAHHEPRSCQLCEEPGGDTGAVPTLNRDQVVRGRLRRAQPSSRATASERDAPAANSGRNAMSWRGRLMASAAVSRPPRP